MGNFEQLEDFMKRVISIMLMLMMLIGSLSIGVLAEGEPAAITDLEAYSAYKSVALEWTPVAGATKYNVYRNGELVKSKSKFSRAYDDPSKMYYIDKTGKEGGSKNSYYVEAVNDNGTSVSNTVKKASVAPMYIEVVFSRTRTLTSHDSGHKTTTFKAGKKVKCFSFRFGKYIFRYKGHTYFCNYMSLHGFNAKYAKKKNYSVKEAEYFAKTAKVKSDTNYMVWASLYSQHIYILKKKAGVWRIKTLKLEGMKKSNWEISSGKAVSPSPAGFMLRIYKRSPSHHGVPWWNFFHSQSSIHGKAGSAAFGMPASAGCIRNPDKYAKLIYKKVPIQSRVVVY